MKRWIFFELIIVLLALDLMGHVSAAENEEDTLIQVLQSDASPAQKDAACARLKRIGTAHSVPALAGLLRDKELSHSARYALESMQSAEAGASLLAALDSTTGLTRLGIINSLEFRREPQAVPALAILLETSDPQTATAAARALGEIGGPEAAKDLQGALRKGPGKVHSAVVDGLLRCANSFLASGNRSKARSIFSKLETPGETEGTQMAAFRGILLSSGNAAVHLMARAIVGERGPRQSAALQFVRDVQAEHATRDLAKLLPKVKPEVQTALVEGLAQRGDSSAAPNIATLASIADPQVRPAILNALGLLGSSANIPLLSGFAASGNRAEQEAARRALAGLRGSDVTDTLLSQLSTSPPEVQVELTRALGARADKSAVPKLVGLARTSGDSVRKAALKALAELAEKEHLASVFELVLTASDGTARQEAAEALNAVYQRFESRHEPVPVAPLVEALKIGTPAARASLLPICSGVAQEEVRVALRGSMQDPEPQVRAAAVRALCDTTDPELLDDVANVAQTSKQENVRILAFAGTVRLATQEDSIRISRPRQVSVLKSLLSAASNPEEKRMVLAGLAEVPSPDALALVNPVLDDEAVRNEAARAAVKIGLSLPGSQSQLALATLDKALTAATDNSTRQAVEAALKQVKASADYITDWQVSGPYRQAGKDYSALFDVAFPPEVGDGSKAAWRALSPGSDPNRPWVMDLLKACGGEQCVAYARTWVHSDQEQPVRLELGSDDGVKVWLNAKQVYALNTARPIQPGSDKVDLTLNSGWNLLLFKVTQNNQGWEFCARFLKPDGSHIDGLTCGATAKPDAGAAQ